MSGSTISKYTYLAVTLGSGTYTGPLSITSNGEIKPESYGATGLVLPAGVSNPTIFNSGYIYGGVGTYSPSVDGGIGVYVATGLKNAVINNYYFISGGNGSYYGAPGYGAAGGAGVVLLAGEVNNASNSILGVGTIYGGHGGVNVSGAGGVGGVGITVGAGANLYNAGYVYGGAGGTGTLGAGGVGGTGVSIINGLVVNSASGAIYGGGAGVSDTGFAGSNGGAAVVLSGGTLITSGNVTGGVGSPNGGTGGAGIVLTSGVAVNSGEILGGNGTPGGTIGGNGGIGVYLDGGTLINAGTITGGQGGKGGTSTLTGTAGDAIVFGNVAGTLVVDPGSVFFGAVIAKTGVADVLELAGATGSYLGGLGTQVTNFNIIDLAAGASRTIAGNAAGLVSHETIAGFAAGDTIFLSGFTASSDSFVTGAGLVVSNGSATETLGITGNFASNAFQIIDIASGTEIMVCYLRGTRIATPRGEIIIEDLRIGDDVFTRFGGTQRIKWIGHQGYAKRFLRNNRDQMPVRIESGALGHGLPARDLFVSPGHSILLGETLVLAQALVNGVNITQIWAPEEVHYYNIELETHDCVQAEGVWAETYADCPGLRAQFHNAASFDALYPDAPLAPPAPKLCAPRPLAGPDLAAALAPVVALAALETAPGPLLGYIDRISKDGLVEGWAQDTANPELPVLLELLVDGIPAGTILACDERRDVKAAGVAAGRCGFAWQAPVPGLTTARLGLRYAGGKTALPTVAAASY